jgi:hypothetical protein
MVADLTGTLAATKAGLVAVAMVAKATAVAATDARVMDVRRVVVTPA